MSRPAGAAERFTYETTDDLASLEPLWTALAARSDNVFATYEWLATWWRHFGRDRPLLLTTVHDGTGEPIAILPLYLAARRPLRVVRLLGHGGTDQLGPVCAIADRLRARQALAEYLTERTDQPWDLAIADDLPAGDATGDPLPNFVRESAESGAPTYEVRNGGGGRGGAIDGSRLLARVPTHVVSLGATGTTADGWLAARSGNLRSQLSRAERSLGQLGTVELRTTDDPATLARDLGTLLDLHARRWDPDGGSRSFTGREAFHHEVAATLLERGWLRLRFLEVDGTAVAAAYSFGFDGVESHYQGGRDPAFDRYSVGLLLHQRAIAACAVAGGREYRFLRGDEAYKRRFADRVDAQESVAWARGPLGRAGLAAVAQLPRLSRKQARWVPAPLAWGTGGSPRWGPP